MKLGLWAACAAIALSGGTAAGAENPKTSPGVWSSGDVDGVVSALGDVKRDSEMPQKDRKRSIGTVFDTHLPSVFQECELKLSFDILRLAYAYIAEKPGTERDVKEFATKILSPSTNMLAATERCKAELKSFAIAIIRVDRGPSWGIQGSPSP